MRKKSAGGFTLLEFLIVIGLMGILILIVTPQLLDFNKKRYLTSVAEDLSQAFEQAQLFAAKGVQTVPGVFIKHYEVRLTRDSGDGAGYYSGYQIVRVDENDNAVPLAVDDKEYSCPVCIYSANGASFTYRVPTGQLDNLTNDPETVSVCYPGLGSFDINFDSIGKVSIESLDDGVCSCSLVKCSP
ncbi:prepilin-type N-terminal cleavage/methylation domain-containing protein [candidate division WWE3 bacterium]|uniref:Prepilin-type N-terminal cleavage/methylation domain-containing protein n=1 Tax=candidate division WWE3 bacterium TaxID=2053526 RepID=A0A955LLI8_UNCKA|nr:prepilin-type N-terminal cleavage/methylation domain-containing protein [candidate division WWE3 bacterium]